MIFVGMGADHNVQFFDSLLLQVTDHHLTVFPIAAVDEHVFAAAFQQNAVRLTHIQIVDGQFFSRCRWGCGS